ncbi:type-F conjugative transfer system pilin assembly protein TrbC [Sphingomonas sp. 2R-10]|uniref:type-F conjugative transfer system pilin assembly protein TrbC n=1 Tax=Sphingomonas sp. 2R-10 TaxID=3045148 RepID=UPI0019D26A42|nr:type-F conjugative transfer system pilin assembly protein TrbC [Sphingomonas sp. 2R-10]MDJ0277728.1 type-F conjugative transfer system pilin assembly protein TrbC [Sphingomonas sp. 2R-10]
MRTPARWASSVLLLAGSAAAQVPPAPPQDARPRVSDEGAAAMERLRAATARRTAEAGRTPTLPSAPDAASQRRAIDAMRRRQASPRMDDRARAGLTKGREALVSQRDAMAKRLGQALGLDAPDMAAVAGVVAPGGTGWVPVLFVSSSMPVTMLRTYAGQLERVGGVLAFRGMPGGMTRVAPMAKLSAEILRRDAGCSGPSCAMRAVQVIVDPLVFRQHGIARVPALAMIPGDPTRPYCEREEGSPRGTHVVYGDATLSGLLDEYARLGGTQEVRDARRRLESR